MFRKLKLSYCKNSFSQSILNCSCKLQNYISLNSLFPKYIYILSFSFPAPICLQIVIDSRCIVLQTGNLRSLYAKFLGKYIRRVLWLNKCICHFKCRIQLIKITVGFKQDPLICQQIFKVTSGIDYDKCVRWFNEYT